MVLCEDEDAATREPRSAMVLLAPDASLLNMTVCNLNENKREKMLKCRKD